MYLRMQPSSTHVPPTYVDLCERIDEAACRLERVHASLSWFEGHERTQLQTLATVLAEELQGLAVEVAVYREARRN